MNVVLKILFAVVVLFLAHMVYRQRSASGVPDGPVTPLSHETNSNLYPALYICHGGGPLPVLGDRDHKHMVDKWREHVRAIVSKHGPPKAIAVVSAHYNTRLPEVGGAARPTMFYDYGGFPKESYSLVYAAPGAPSLAERMVSSMKERGLLASVNPDRRYDHGVFVPLMVMFEEETIPVVPISVLRGDNAGEHIKMGQALRQFREEGVFFIGSGSSMHHFDHLWDGTKGAGTTFNNALTDIIANPHLSPEERLSKMSRVSELDGFSEAHPINAQEHLMPLLTLLGTADGSVAREVANIPFYAANVRHYLFES
ncbi:Catalytic LigB subunit of aromatic ring-opening dioxygenase, putative [Angomonas deanei]|uniref:Catalytic LigB subunit of aromatic ring-opening dioxygenase, putative n=1 Tax=Angomonas deanei TaxID=59799 RepID=A0A7G2C349_9TRYP|nr:Catalytic LigB subunit of aromatic ring-opening dioxygenase, putative [Angomonas deanei]